MWKGETQTQFQLFNETSSMGGALLIDSMTHSPACYPSPDIIVAYPHKKLSRLYHILCASKNYTFNLLLLTFLQNRWFYVIPSNYIHLLKFHFLLNLPHKKKKSEPNIMIFSPLDLITLGTFQIQINTTTYHQQYITILLYLKDFIDPHLKVIKYITTLHY